MKKDKGKVVFLVFLFFFVLGLLFWFSFRNAYENKYFTTELQAKYSSLDSVLDVMLNFHSSDLDDDRELLSEALGNSKYSRTFNGNNTLKEVKSIVYSKSNELAFVQFERGGYFFIWHKDRWAFYPETPWIKLIEIKHKI